MNLCSASCLLLLAAIGLPRAAAQEPSASSDASYDGQPASVYIEQLTSEDDNVRRRAAYILGQIGPPANGAIPALATALTDGQMEIRWYAIDALGQFGPSAAEAVPAIIKSLEAKLNDATVRRRGARSLGCIGPASKAAVPALEAALASDDLLYRVAAAEALWRISQHARAVPVLVELLDSEDAEAAMAAALALAELRIDSAQTIQPLIKTLGHVDADVRQAAAHALVEIGPPALEPLSKAIAASSGSRETSGAAEAGIDLDAAATALGRIIDHERRDVLYSEQASKQEFGRAAGPIMRVALPALARRLADQDAAAREAAILAMAKAGSAAIPQLLKSLAGSSMAEREAAALALVRLEAYLPRQRPLPTNLEAAHKRMLPDLISALAVREPASQLAALRLFVALDIGPEGAGAEPHLKTALESSDLATRRYADKALSRLKVEQREPETGVD
jgi:HEAT repeat protein